MLRSSRARSLVCIFAILFIVCSLVLIPSTSTRAASAKEPPGPDRVTVINVNYTAYTWWMATWNKNEIVCTMTIDHDGEPTLGEVYTNCDPGIYYNWKRTLPCDTEPQECKGFYLFLVKTQSAQKQVTVKLPPPIVMLTLEGCETVSRSGTNICETIPKLVLTGEEPLPNQHITRIEGTVDGQSFSCAALCKLKLSPTSDKGVNLQFWAWSSYGDSSLAFNAQVRVATADAGNPDQQSYTEFTGISRLLYFPA